MKAALYVPVGKIYGGAERRLIRIFCELTKRNRNIDLILLGKEEHIEKIINNELHNLHENVWRFTTILDIVKHFIHKHYDWLWFFNVDKCSLILTPIALVLGTKRLMTVANYYYSMNVFERIIVRTAFNFTMRLANYIDCLYDDGVRRLKTVYINKAITQTPMPFTRLDLFFPAPKKRVIVFASRLIKIKKPLLFLESVKIIKNEIMKRNFTVLICGDGDLANDVQSFIKDNGLSEIVEYKGFVQMQQLLPYSSIFASLQLLENYPSQALLEAISSGNFIVVSDVGNSKSLIREEFGLTVTLTKDQVADGLLIAMEKVDSNHESIIRTAREFAVRNFNIVKSVNYFDDILFGSENV